MEYVHLEDSFSKIVNECYKTWNWELDSLFNVVFSDCPYESIFRNILIQSGHREIIEDHLGRSVLPIICMLPNRLSWLAAFEERVEGHYTIHIKGPVFVGYNGLEQYPDFWELFSIPPETRPLIKSALQELPILSHSVIMEFAVILQFCLTGQRIHTKEVVFGNQLMPQTLMKGVQTNQFDKSSGRYELEVEENNYFDKNLC